MAYPRGCRDTGTAKLPAHEAASASEVYQSEGQPMSGCWESSNRQHVMVDPEWGGPAGKLAASCAPTSWLPSDQDSCLQVSTNDEAQWR